MDPIEKALLEAERLRCADKYTKAHKLLAPLVDQQVPAAMYLAACIGKRREKIEAFEQRRFWLLNQAAMLDHAQSIYDLGVQYDTGVGAMKSSVIASVHFEKAAILGHPRAKLMYGLDLVRGLNRIPKDRELGLDYIRQAVAENVEDAANILEKVLAGELD